MSTHTSVPTQHMTLLHMHWTSIQMVLHLFNVRCCGILLGQRLLKVGCLLNGVQQELHFNVTFSCSHLLAKLYPVFGPQMSVKDRGMAQAIVNGHEQQTQ